MSIVAVHHVTRKTWTGRWQIGGMNAVHYPKQHATMTLPAPAHPSENPDFDTAYLPLLDKTQRLKSAEQLANIGIWDSNTISGSVYCSPGMESVFGIPAGSFCGTYEDFARRIHPSDLAAFENERNEAIKQRAPFDLEFRIIRPDGALRWLAARGGATYAEDGTLMGSTGFVVDITERKQQEEHLRFFEEIMSNMTEGVVLIVASTGTIIGARQGSCRLSHAANG
jgi:PAS domain S-box-containing protein